MGKTRYGCHTCGRIGVAKTMRLVDRKQTYGSCLNREACLRRRLRRLKGPDPAECSRRSSVREARRARSQEVSP
jgi:hypothetical protein